MAHINMKIADRIGVIIDNPTYLHSFRLHARETLQQIGHLPDTPLWQYLHWRRALAPARFDRFHPEFRRLFHDEMRHHPTMPTFPVLSPELYPIVVQPPSHPPMMGGAVAELSSGHMWGIVIVVALVWSYGMGRRP